MACCGIKGKKKKGVTRSSRPLHSAVSETNIGLLLINLSRAATAAEKPATMLQTKNDGWFPWLIVTCEVLCSTPPLLLSRKTYSLTSRGKFSLALLHQAQETYTQCERFQGLDTLDFWSLALGRVLRTHLLTVYQLNSPTWTKIRRLLALHVVVVRRSWWRVDLGRRKGAFFFCSYCFG